jgi:hypothetical protein
MNQAGLIHGDLSPFNVVVAVPDAILDNVNALASFADPLVKLIDFGGAAMTGERARFAYPVYQEADMRKRPLTSRNDLIAFSVLGLELRLGLSLYRTLPKPTISLMAAPSASFSWMGCIRIFPSDTRGILFSGDSTDA